MLFRLGLGMSAQFRRLLSIASGLFRVNGTDALLINGSGDKLIIQHKE